ncbi:inorganic diphosphatase [Candidatus Woesearchaeota archaeon]|nr:inorganic diphosphatase [Candidatus Woesearchaeota archaeon]
MNVWHDVSPGENIPEEFEAFIETPAGSRNKYELDKKTGLLRLDRVLYSPVHYPGDYGFIPRTVWFDNDPVDVLVLTHHPVTPGVLMGARPIGVLRMLDKNEEDDKIIAVPIDDPKFNEIKDISQISEHQKKEIKHFFEIYKTLQKVEVKVFDYLGAKEAKETIKKGLKLYKELMS